MLFRIETATTTSTRLARDEIDIRAKAWSLIFRHPNDGRVGFTTDAARPEACYFRVLCTIIAPALTKHRAGRIADFRDTSRFPALYQPLGRPVWSGKRFKS